MSKVYDATTEHRPFVRTDLKGHPRPRKGQTAKRKLKQQDARDGMAKVAPTPAKKKK